MAQTAQPEVKTRGRPGYSIWIVSLPGYPHSRAFEEVALALHEAFAELGFDAPIVTEAADITGVAIVLAAGVLPALNAALPENLIIYNFEQVQAGSPWMNQAYIDILKRYPVWDYSQRNIEALAAMGIKGVSLCGVGYTPGLTRIPHSLMQDIDVCFIGAVNDRRAAVLDDMSRHGLKLFVGQSLYGQERDAIFARSKIVLNLHHYEAQVFEIVRVSYLLANRICVVSETGFDLAMEEPFLGGVGFTNFAQLTMGCRYLMQHPEERRRMAGAGFAAFSAMSQTPMLKGALARLPNWARAS